MHSSIQKDCTLSKQNIYKPTDNLRENMLSTDYTVYPFNLLEMPIKAKREMRKYVYFESAGCETN